MENRTEITLRYIDDSDRAYGASGMAVAVVVCNAESIIDAIDLDAADPADIMELSDDYYMAGSHAESVSAAWQQTLGALRATIVMASGNLLARHMVGHSERVSADLRNMLRDAVTEEAKAECQLEADEIDELFSSTYNYLQRLFANSQVGHITSDFANILMHQRRMSHAEILQTLRPLVRVF